jgi:hypothetical protein
MAPKIQQHDAVPTVATVPPSPPVVVAVTPASAPKPPVETKREARVRKRAKWLKADAGTVAAVAEHKEDIVGGVKAVSEEIKRAKQEQKAREDAGK